MNLLARLFFSRVVRELLLVALTPLSFPLPYVLLNLKHNASYPPRPSFSRSGLYRSDWTLDCLVGYPFQPAIITPRRQVFIS